MKARWLPLAAILLLACGTAPSTPSAPDVARPGLTEEAPTAVPSLTPSIPHGPQCLPPGVELSVGEVDAAMGLRAVGITLRNCGTATYTVNGYPVVEVLDAQGRVLDVAVLHGVENVASLDQYTEGPKRIDVAPGESVGAALVWRNLTTDAATVAKGAYLSVAPAQGQPRHTLALATDPGNTGKMGVSPWRTVRR